MSSSADSDQQEQAGPSTGIGGDIDIAPDKMQSFFFMDSDEEQQAYGVTTKSSMALTNTFLKNASKQKVSITI